MSLDSQRGRCVSFRRATSHSSNFIFASVYTICITAEAFSRACGVFLAATEGREHLDGMGSEVVSAMKFAVRMNIILNHTDVSFQGSEY